MPTKTTYFNVSDSRKYKTDWKFISQCMRLGDMKTIEEYCNNHGIPLKRKNIYRGVMYYVPKEALDGIPNDIRF